MLRGQAAAGLVGLLAVRAVLSCDRTKRTATGVDSSAVEASTGSHDQAADDAWRRTREILAISEPLKVAVPKDLQAADLPKPILRALEAPPGLCLVVWGDYRSNQPRRAVVFVGPDGRSLSDKSCWVVCPAVDAGYPTVTADPRIQLDGWTSFNGDYFEYKALRGDDMRRHGQLWIHRNFGSAVRFLSQIGEPLRESLVVYMVLQ